MEPKDYVAMITGTVGTVTGVTALIRGWYLNKKLYWEPYFRKKWPVMSESLGIFLQQTRYYLQTVSRDISEEDPESIHHKVAEIEPDLNIIDWTYTKKTKIKIEKMINITGKVSDLASEYNKLRYLTSQDLHLANEIAPIYEYMLENDSDMDSDSKSKLEETRSRRRDRNEWVSSLARQYGMTDQSTMADLKRNPVYKNDLSILRSSIKAHIELMNQSLKEVEAEIDFLDTTFLTET